MFQNVFHVEVIRTKSKPQGIWLDLVLNKILEYKTTFVKDYLKLERALREG